MIPFWPDPDWYTTHWYGSPPPRSRRRRFRQIAGTVLSLLRRAPSRRLPMPAQTLLERLVP